MKLRTILGSLLLVFAGLLVCSQAVAVFNLLSFQFDGFDFARHYAIVSSIQSYGLALAALVVGIIVLRSSAVSASWAALSVTLVSLWFMVIQELWLYYFELPGQYPHFAAVHPPYFTGSFWMFTPRFLWHLILPVAVLLATINVFSNVRKSMSNN